MNKSENLEVMMILKAAYPNYYNQNTLRDATILWGECLIDDSFNLISKAVREFIKTDISGFPPTIGQIRNLSQQFKFEIIEENKTLQIEHTRDRTPEEQAEQDKAKAECMRKLKGMWKC